jgi:phage-related protein
MTDKEKPLEWIASSYKDLMALPPDVRRRFGYALSLAQMGDQDDAAKVLKGFGGAGVLEVIEDDAGGTYRAVYTVKFAEAVFVLHCFQKKSKSGIATPKVDMDIIRARLKVAEALAQELQMQKRIIEGVEVQRSSGNVFADLGLPDAEKLKIKTGLVVEIRKAMRALGLTQQAAAKRMGIPQPKVSGMMHGDFTNLSERKLMDCLNRLGYDIEIKVRPASEPVGHLTLATA